VSRVQSHEHFAYSHMLAGVIHQGIWYGIVVSLPMVASRAPWRSSSNSFCVCTSGNLSLIARVAVDGPSTVRRRVTFPVAGKIFVTTVVLPSSSVTSSVKWRGSSSAKPTITFSLKQSIFSLLINFKATVRCFQSCSVS